MAFGEGSERKRLEREMREAGRLPPGQSLTLKWPVLHVGGVPQFDPQSWDFRVKGLVENPLRLTWDEFTRLPLKEITADMHCVTRWSRFDVRWEGVPVAEVMKLARPKPEAKYAMVLAEEDFTSNVPLGDLLRPTSLFALKHNGEPLPADHGYPLRLVVPHLYAWKSVKWVRGLDLRADDAPGFWEDNGYHMYGDPFKEQRFDTD
ncbi:MAG TPA: sulfite oxidase-like oxidoreductase [Candidatus Polarisedimenticolia bacterium]|jgi:DMSO/TMAO reductase YedYZ molybdopterin-dependent catalytic subunit|nr:sulfite oxidase-like oxidoreductase [Candidatus Polarisedimenticolia bacterium]